MDVDWLTTSKNFIFPALGGLLFGGALLSLSADAAHPLHLALKHDVLFVFNNLY